MTSYDCIDSNECPSYYTLEESSLLDHNSDHDNPTTWPNPEFEWEKNEKGVWDPIIHSLRSTTSPILDPIQSMHPKLSINTINTVPQHHHQPTCHTTKVSFADPKQSDSGANTTATNNLQLLHDVVFIHPVNVVSATEKAKPMQMLAIGNIHLRTISGKILKIASYYSPDISGTIVSPDAIARQYKDRFQGFRKICDCHNNKGYLILDSVSKQHQAASFRLESHNNL